MRFARSSLLSYSSNTLQLPLTYYYSSTYPPKPKLLSLVARPLNMEESYKLFLLSMLMSLTFLSNSCGILALYKRKIAGGKLTRMYYFLLHLFITDIIVTFSTLLPELIITAVSGSKFPWNDTICKCMKFVKMFGPYLR